MKVNQAGIDLIKRFEALLLTSYKDIVGKLTIGYGHTLNVEANQIIDKAQAEEFLKQDLGRVEAYIGRLALELTENQFAAIASLIYNIGMGAFSQSTMLKVLKDGDIVMAAEQFLRWDKAHGEIVAGLTRRREAEKTLFLS